MTSQRSGGWERRGVLATAAVGALSVIAIACLGRLAPQRAKADERVYRIILDDITPRSASSPAIEVIDPTDFTAYHRPLPRNPMVIQRTICDLPGSVDDPREWDTMRAR